MQVFVAEPCGFCYGVKRAVDMARGECGKETHAATLGPLIHNPQLTAELAAGGVSCCGSLDSFEKGDTVIFRSHGVGPEVYAAAEEKGLNIIEPTIGGLIYILNHVEDNIPLLLENDQISKGLWTRL